METDGGEADKDAAASADYWLNLRARRYAGARGILVESLNTPGEMMKEKKTSIAPQPLKGR